MNPCETCYLDKLGCHQSGFADAKCGAWIAWKTEVLIFLADLAHRRRELQRRQEDYREESLSHHEPHH